MCAVRRCDACVCCLFARLLYCLLVYYEVFIVADSYLLFLLLFVRRVFFCVNEGANAFVVRLFA